MADTAVNYYYNAAGDMIPRLTITKLTDNLLFMRIGIGGALFCQWDAEQVVEVQSRDQSQMRQVADHGPADVLDGASPGDFNLVVWRLRLLLALRGQTILRLLVTFHLLFGQAEQIHRRDQIAEEQDHRLKWSSLIRHSIWNQVFNLYKNLNVLKLHS